MAIVTATEVTIYTDISCSAGTTTLALLIPIVQSRINAITNNYFVSDMYIAGTFTFSSTANSITSTSDWEDYGFMAGDEVYIHNSYRNDGYYTVSALSSTELILTSANTVVSELSGRSIIVSVVDWPGSIKYLAAQMIKYDYDDRPDKAIGVASETLGPYSVSYGTSVGSGSGSSTPYGYPQEFIDSLRPFTRVRFK